MTIATTLPGMPDGLVFLPDHGGGVYAVSALRDADGNALLWKVLMPKKVGSKLWTIEAHRTLKAHLRQTLQYSKDRCIEECERAERLARAEHARRSPCGT